MLVQQSDDVCIETVEASNSVDQFLIVLHLSIIFKILDFVKYFVTGKNGENSSFLVSYILPAARSLAYNF